MNNRKYNVSSISTNGKFAGTTERFADDKLANGTFTPNSANTNLSLFERIKRRVLNGFGEGGVVPSAQNDHEIEFLPAAFARNIPRTSKKPSRNNANLDNIFQRNYVDPRHFWRRRKSPEDECAETSSNLG